MVAAVESSPKTLAEKGARLRCIDTDVHNDLPSFAELEPFLAREWHPWLEDGGPGLASRYYANTGSGRMDDAVREELDVLSDAAPKLTGIRDADRAREEALLEAIEALIPQLLRPGGALVVKILEGPEAQAIERRLRARFASAHSTRPDSSRKGTSERYLVLKGLRS